MTTVVKIFMIAAVLALQPAAIAMDSSGLPPGITAKDLPRFMRLAEGVYRGGQPNNGGFAALQRMGIRTVVNFREGHEERELVEKLGMKSVHIPLSALRGVPNGAVEKFFELLLDRDNYPIFIHCRRGADRTGAMAAFYRIKFQGWDGRKAAGEARAAGMRWWYLKLKRQIENFDPGRYQISVAAH